MIAASDPQEFVPSGRQQTARHPGPINKFTKEIENKLHLLDKLDAVILDKLERVSLTDNNEEKEWWILRKSSDLFDHKDEPDKCVVNIPNDHNIDSPLGINRTVFDFHEVPSSRQQRISDSNVSKLRRLSSGSESSKYSLYSVDKQCDGNPQGRTKRFHTKNKTGCVEEELYVKGHTVVWSRSVMGSSGIMESTRKTICSYTSRAPIKCVLWCNFCSELPPYNTTSSIESKSDKHGTKLPSVCVVDCQNIKVFTEKGEDFQVTVPFKIGTVWNTAYGVLIERKLEEDSKDATFGGISLYSLAYPLDDVCPIVLNHGGFLQFPNHALKILYTSEVPSVCVVYDTQTKQHIAYRIRRIRTEEKNFYEKSVGQTPSGLSSSDRLRSRLSIWENVQSNNQSPIGKGLNLSGTNQPSKSQNSMATISRCQSSISSATSSSQLGHASSVHNPSQTNERSMFDCNRSLILTGCYPLITMDFMWAEPNLGDDTSNVPASKVFLCDDLAEQSYLCYISSSKLFMVKADFSNPSNFSFGSSNNISAKDAVPLPHLHMLAILDFSGNVTLYSGMTIVGKLHLHGTLVKHTPTPNARRIQTQLQSPFPRRSSLLPHSEQSDPQFEHLFSPVLSDLPKRQRMIQMPLQHEEIVTLIGLRDALENRLTLYYSDETFYRVKLPLFATSPLVEDCLNVLKQCLQREAVITFFTRWYATRNSLGTQNSTHDQEWEMFITLIYELLGYEEEQTTESSKDVPPTPSSKKSKQSRTGSDDDWAYLLNTEYHKVNNIPLSSLLNISPITEHPSKKVESDKVRINTNAILFPFIKHIHFSLHLLYEDFKLDVLKYNLLRPLAKFLCKLTNDMSMIEYSVYYWKDFPEDCTVSEGSQVSFPENKYLNVEFEGVIDMMQHISCLINGTNVSSFPYLRNVNERSRDVVQICGLLSSLSTDSVLSREFMCSTKSDDVNPQPFSNSVEDVVLLMTKMNITTKILETLPFGLYLFFYNAIWKCRENPPADWPSEAYILICREDLGAHSMKMGKDTEEAGADKFDIGSMNQLDDLTQPDSDQLDGMEDTETSLTKLRFPDDVRVSEARKMLQSSKPVPILLVQRPDISDHDFIEEQEKHLYAVCTRTMALPVGRGMFTLRTGSPLITKPLPLPQLCLTGKAAPRGTTVELTHIDTPSNMSLWPLFHNGVANGLRISPNASNIDNTWIVFNKPKGTEKLMEHGGFLMALGLHGHLKNLDVWNRYDYLNRKHEMISIGMLLGLSSSFRGTSHIAVTKILSIHIEGLLPPTSMELDSTQPCQVAALLGIGLLYQGSAHTHMTEVLLSEIGRPPGPEMENSSDRESYSLAAGLALGLVTLQKGEKSTLSDFNVSDTLHYYMTGGTRRPFTGSQRDKYKVPSFQIREGACVNLDVTAPGATLALGLMYLGTNNKTIADWMSPPDTQYLLDSIRPDFLMLRIISKSLILWNQIDPSQEWVEDQVPKSIRPFCMVQPSPLVDIDYEAMNQAYCHLITGACFAIGLKYAGSADERAFRTLLHYCHMFISLTGKSISELAGKPTIETCLNVLLISASMVMAGTGNLDIMRIVRHLRKRVGLSSSAVVTYGSHLAIHMSLGLLYLGGGRCTLSNSPSSVAALICAFYPKFPTHSNDNRYHLQAFRHLYVLATETRILIPREVYSGKICYANLKIVKTDGSTLDVKAPAMLPDLEKIRSVSVNDERYWKILFKRDKNWILLKKILSGNGFVEVKQRAGCLSYVVDKFGYHSQFARTLTQSKVLPWNPSSSAIKGFTSNESVKIFCDNFLSYDGKNVKECKLKKVFTKITYDAVVMDKLVAIPAFAAIRKMIEDLQTQPNNIQLKQFKLVLDQSKKSHNCDILSSEMVFAMEEEILECLENWETSLGSHLVNFVSGRMEYSDDLSICSKLATYVTFYDIPYNFQYRSTNFLGFLHDQQDKFQSNTLFKLLKVLNISSQ